MKRSKHSKAFRRIFGVSLERFTGSLALLASLSGRFDFDVIKFDDWCKTMGYIEDNETSCADFIMSKWGKDAEDLVQKIIRGE
mgnify:CR=1 FL=1